MTNSLYIHIPFCLKRCIYCDFVSGLYNPEKADLYVEALIKEIAKLPDEISLSTLYIGGGTPTALTINTLSELLSHIFNRSNFNDNYEASIEANPGTLNKDKLPAIQSAGINRVSIGVQSFNDSELDFLGRIHTSGEAEDAVHLARDCGFNNIGIDLIYGIPGQTSESWKSTLKKTVSLKPHHISTYELTVEKGTLLYEYLISHPHPLPSRERETGRTSPSPRGRGLGGGGNKFTLPEEDKIIEMYEHTIDYLTSEGYIHYEISNFSLPDFQCRHNLNYWDRGEYFGAGLGAHSFIKGKRFHNTNDLDEYIKLIFEDKSPVKKSETITDDMALSEALFLGLRKTGGINLESFSKRYKKNILAHFDKEIKELQETGLIEITGSSCSYEINMRLTKKGLLLSNEAFQKFI